MNQVLRGLLIMTIIIGWISLTIFPMKRTNKPRVNCQCYGDTYVYNNTVNLCCNPTDCYHLIYSKKIILEPSFVVLYICYNIVAVFLLFVLTVICSDLEQRSEEWKYNGYLWSTFILCMFILSMVWIMIYNPDYDECITSKSTFSS